MAKTSTMHKKLPSRGIVVFRLLVLCVFFSFVVSILQTQSQISAQQAVLDGYEQQIAAQTQENAALRAQVEDGVTEEYIASLARNAYDYVQPNERVYIDSSSN